MMMKWGLSWGKLGSLRKNDIDKVAAIPASTMPLTPNPTITVSTITYWVSMEYYTKIEIIEECTYGVIYKGRQKITSQLVVRKKIRLGSKEEDVPSTIIQEISLLKEVCHSNIVSLQDMLIQDSRLYHIFEFLGS